MADAAACCRSAESCSPLDANELRLILPIMSLVRTELNLEPQRARRRTKERFNEDFMATTTEIPVTLNKDEILRYSRHLIMPEVGMEGQQKLKAARVLCIGTGGLGSPMALYLAAAGVGTLGLVDFDVVDYTNLQRQIIHFTADVGRKKLDSAADKLKAINPFIELRTFDTKLSSANAMELFRDFDIIADGTDNFPTRYLVNDACVLSGKPND